LRPLPDRLIRIIESLENLERDDRMEMLIGIAKSYPHVPERMARRPYAIEHRVPGCESEAYVWAEPLPDGTQKYYFAVENPQGISAMALAAILGKTLSGVPLDEVRDVPSDVVYRIFGAELSMGKSMGLMGMVNMVRSSARQVNRPLEAGNQGSPGHTG
jgi:cysteine desulfuration protein SufE